MIYLATPIKHTDPTVESWRVQVATRAAASLHDAGIPVFSPATHGHGFAKIAGTRQGWDYWSRVDLPILTNCCSMLAVLNLSGWTESVGVQCEIRESGIVGIPIVHIKFCICGEALVHHTPHVLCETNPAIPLEITRLIAA